MIKRISLVISILFFSFCSEAQFSVRIQITGYFNISDYRADVLFVAGSFNSWNPGDSNYRMLTKPNGIQYSDLILYSGTYEYKITRGGWDKVECKADGTEIQNRVIKIERDTTISITIEGWKDNFKIKPRTSTASRNVHIIDTAFLIPQLNRKRKVWVYLPPTYDSSQKKYSVLYMQDGQNVFDDSTSFAGEWGVDETLDSISRHSKEIIVVAVDHGGSKRINEYCPYNMEKYGKGEGGPYLDFLVKTLKPFIDKHYRTKRDKQNTFIAGSSMGGLISMYAVLKYPKTFGGAGIFSPAFWIGPKIFDDINKKGEGVNSKIYFYCGGQESETMQPEMERAFEEMRKVSRSNMVCIIRPDGKHTEWVWKEEFPLFYLWLMMK